MRFEPLTVVNMNPTVLWKDKTSKIEAARYFEMLVGMQHSNLRHIQQDL